MRAHSPSPALRKSAVLPTLRHVLETSSFFKLTQTGTRPLTSLPIAGALISRTGGSYWGLILFTGLNYGVAAVCFVLARGVAAGWHLKTIF